jgi:hypothetical protein
MSNNYDEDLAYIHHRGFGGFANNAARGLLKLLRDHGIDSGLILAVEAESGRGILKIMDMMFSELINPRR